MPDSRLAVFPFSNQGNDPAQDYFGEGLAAELLICLARVEGLHPLARSSVFALPPDRRIPDRVGELLDATCLLTGSVSLQDQKLLVSAQLQDVETQRILWSGRYERPLEGIFGLLDEIAEGVAGALGRAEASATVRSITSLHSGDVKAYDRYLRGREAYYEYSRNGIRLALQLFREAIQMDPAYALAYAGEADCYSYAYLYIEHNDENRERAERAARHALELDPELPEAFASLGLALALCGGYAESEAALARARELNPRLFEAHYFSARNCFAQGNLKEAIEHFAGARSVRPEDYQSPLLMGQIYDSLEDPLKAGTIRDDGVELARRHLELNPGDVRALYMGANGLVALGRVTEGRAWLERALEIGGADAMLLYNAGCIYALLGAPDEALDCLERSVAGGLTQKEWYENDSNLDSLRGTLRFEALLGEMARGA